MQLCGVFEYSCGHKCNVLYIWFSILSCFGLSLVLSQTPLFSKFCTLPDQALRFEQL